VIHTRAQAGLTLVELLVATAVFSIIGAAAYAGLISVLEAREHADRRAERLAAVQYAVDTLGDDVRQIVPRGVRTDLRDRGHAVTDGPDSRDVILLTRGGWPNPADLDRATLARVEWRLEDERLLRLWRTRPDAATATAETRRIMLEDVTAVSLRFLDQSGGWQERWPGLDTLETSDKIPRAIEVRIELDDWGDVVRLFELAPGAYAPVGVDPEAEAAES
jgi:general secretion pathway protein J